MSARRTTGTKVALVFAGGDAVPAAVSHVLPDEAIVIAADSGLAYALELGRHVDAVVGDFDSVEPEALAAAEAAGAAVERHPTEKNATDLELAIVAAVARGANHITVVGGHGGRFDHFLANALLFGSARFESTTVDAWIGHAHLAVVRDRVDLHGRPGDLCTLLALGGVARGVTTTGLRFPLDDDVLLPGSTRGVSNELVESVASVSLRTGVLLAIQPNALLES